MMLTLSLSLALALPTIEHKLETVVPGDVVQVGLSLPRFWADNELAGEGTLWGGKTLGDAILTVRFEQNFPFLSGEECVKRWKGMPKFKRFSAGGVACFEYRNEIQKGFVQNNFYAFLTTPDYVFILHLSQMDMGTLERDETWNRKSFGAIVENFKAEGRTDPSKLRFPVEVYAFRDEVAAQKSGHDKWAERQARERPDEYAPHFYLGVLGLQREDHRLAVRGHERAIELLEGLEKRSPKETRVYANALGGLGESLAALKKFRDALPIFQRLSELADPEDSTPLEAFRNEALYGMAYCHAQARNSKEALRFLRLAIEAQPTQRRRAKQDPLFRPLASSKDFKALVGS